MQTAKTAYKPYESSLLLLPYLVHVSSYIIETGEFHAYAQSGVPPLPALPCSTLPRCVKSNAALMNNAESAVRVLLTFGLLSTCQAAGVCQSNSGSAELSHVSRQK